MWLWFPLLDLFTRKRVVARGEGYRPPSGPGAATSPLRFTWELGLPPWVRDDGADPDRAVALVTDDPGRPLPPRVLARIGARRLDRAFELDEGVFRHRTLVRVYRITPQ